MFESSETIESALNITELMNFNKNCKWLVNSVTMLEAVVQRKRSLSNIIGTKALITVNFRVKY